MSWIDWPRDPFPTTQGAATLTCHLTAPDMGGPRQRWTFDLGSQVRWPEGVPSKYKVQRVMNLEFLDLGVQVEDLREFSGLVIRSTPEWLVKVQESGQYGRLVEPVLSMHHWKISLETQEHELWEDYQSVEWELRFGQLDGTSLSCELEAWALIPRDDFYRKEPETREELAKFAEGEPMLRMMSRVDIESVTVELPRCGDDPLPLARRRLKEALGIDEWKAEKLFWDSNYVAMPEHKAVTEPGWRSAVRYEL